jgi:hypothetical protein
MAIWMSQTIFFQDIIHPDKYTKFQDNPQGIEYNSDRQAFKSQEKD